MSNQTVSKQTKHSPVDLSIYSPSEMAEIYRIMAEQNYEQAQQIRKACLATLEKDVLSVTREMLQEYAKKTKRQVYVVRQSATRWYFYKTEIESLNEKHNLPARLCAEEIVGTGDYCVVFKLPTDF